MSGIYGFSVTGVADDGLLAPLVSWNAMYGPDAAGQRLAGKSGLGCAVNRLNDDAPLGQPVIAHDTRLAVIDAVLFNRADLESALDAEEPGTVLLPVAPAGLSDAELLFYYTSAFGFGALAQVNGDFAGAVLDTTNGEWTLFRDHMGVRPLFYYADADCFVFSTDMRGILAFPGVDQALNEENLYLHMMGYNTLTLCDTEYQHIHCLHPASWVTFAPNAGNQVSDGTNNTQTDAFKAAQQLFDQQVHVYWQLGQHKITRRDDKAYADELRWLITDSVERRLKATSGIVGCELSGGLDSSVVAILISRLGREGRYFSWSWSPDVQPLMEGEDERKIIRDICLREGITCHFARKLGVDDCESMQDSLDKNNVPYLNTPFLSEGSAWVRSQGARVMFTGHGGDEGVSHRSNFFELWYNGERRALLPAIWRSTKGQSLRPLRWGYRVVNQFAKVHPYFKEEFRSGKHIESLMSGTFKDRMANTPHPPLYFAYDPVAYIMQGGTRVRMDNAAVQGAQNGVQYLFPFLDYRVIDFAVSIPRECYQNGTGNRRIYRQAFDDIMPQSLRDMHYKDTPSQRGLTIDDFPWAAGTFRQTVAEVLAYLDRDFWATYLDWDAVEAAVQLREDFSEEEYGRASFVVGELMYCAALQNLHVKLAAQATSADVQDQKED